MSDLRQIAFDGLWKNNPGLVQLLGLCPLLAVTTSASSHGVPIVGTTAPSTRP